MLIRGKVGLVAFLSLFFTPMPIQHGTYYPSHRINEVGFRKICDGMSARDVEAVLGVSYGRYFTGKIRGTFPSGPANSTGEILGPQVSDKVLNCTVTTTDGRFLFQRKGWLGNEFGIWVWFDKNGVVTGKKIYKVERIQAGN